MFTPASPPEHPPAIITSHDDIDFLPRGCLYIYITETSPDVPNLKPDAPLLASNVSTFSTEEDDHDDPTNIGVSKRCVDLLVTTLPAWDRDTVADTLGEDEDVLALFDDEIEKTDQDIADEAVIDSFDPCLGLDKSGWFASQTNPNSLGGFFDSDYFDLESDPVWLGDDD